MTGQSAQTGDLVVLNIEAAGVGSGARVFLVTKRGHKWGHLVSTGHLALGLVKRVRVPVSALRYTDPLDDSHARTRYQVMLDHLLETDHSEEAEVDQGDDHATTEQAKPQQATDVEQGGNLCLF